MSHDSLTLPGVAVEYATVDLQIAEPALDVEFEGGDRITADRRRALVQAFGGRYGVENGDRVTIDTGEGVPADILAAVLRSTVTAFLLAQQGRFAVHANAVRTAHGALAIAGERGAGKSTTSVRLHQRGAPLLADDVSPLVPKDGAVILEPTGRPLRLTPRTAEALDVDTTGAVREALESEKLILTAPSAPPTPLAGVVVLDVAADAEDVATDRLRGAAAVAALEGNLYRGELIHPIYRSDTFAWAAAVAAGVPVFRISRPPSGWTLEAVADAVERLAAEQLISPPGPPVSPPAGADDARGRGR